MIIYLELSKQEFILLIFIELLFFFLKKGDQTMKAEEWNLEGDKAQENWKKVICQPEIKKLILDDMKVRKKKFFFNLFLLVNLSKRR
jgi:hypothetical protein